MTTDIRSADFLNEEEPGKTGLPSGLNILTILTFIWCGLSLILTLCMPAIYDFFLNFMDKARDSGKEISAKDLAKMEEAREGILLAQQNMLPLMIIGIAGIVLCFIGALRMRKLRKDGYFLYVAGELAPPVAMFFILGTAQYEGVVSILMAIVIPVLFVILYTMQRKHLRY